MEQAQDIETLINRILELPEDWHGAGTVSPATLWAIARRAGELGPIRQSVETGAGRTTLLLSHLSANHTFFAVNDGNSVRVVLDSPLFNASSSTLVEGPTQRTLPTYTFSEKVQFALIDGPHGYPFPDLEYYFLYPHIAEGGLLILDDIKIPSIRRMFDILKADEMFQLLEVADENTAFFRRTSAPAINPESDSWWLQGYNKPYYKMLIDQKPKFDWRASLLRRTPEWIKRIARRVLGRPR